MKKRLVRWLIVLGWVFFFPAILFVYFFPRMAANRALSVTMYVVGLLVIAPSLVWLLVRVCRHGLRIAR